MNHAPSRLPVATLLALLLTAPAAPLLASETHGDAPAAKPAKADAKAEAKPEAKPEAADPLDRVRERLAAKLGAQPAPEARTSNVVRVANRPAPEVAPAALRHATAAGKPGGAKPAEAKAAGHGEGAHWSYAGETGPAAWGAMKPEFGLCATGKRQSPIDIRDGIAVDLEPVQFDYRASSFRVIDNGHTVQVNVSPGNFIQMGGRRWELVQFHFHRPSEERVDGRQFDMVAHLVHKDVDGRLAVVAVLLERGSAQPVVQTVWNNLPLEKGEEVAGTTVLDLNYLLPPDRRYYTYMGSLTTPPCSEGVTWVVLRQPVPLSQQQIDIFSRLYPMNARPVQQAAGRLIKQSQ